MSGHVLWRLQNQPCVHEGLHQRGGSQGAKAGRGRLESSTVPMFHPLRLGFEPTTVRFRWKGTVLSSRIQMLQGRVKARSLTVTQLVFPLVYNVPHIMHSTPEADSHPITPWWGFSGLRWCCVCKQGRLAMAGRCEAHYNTWRRWLGSERPCQWLDRYLRNPM